MCSSDLGNNTKRVRAWRALGRTLCDIHLLVFNIGRADFRSKFVEPFTIMIQTSSSNAMGLQEVGLAASVQMIRAGAALTDARGIIMILDKIMIAASGADAAASGDRAAAPAPPRNSRLKKYHLWAFTRTHLAHRCWRWFPGLVKHLPHMLLGGTMQGVALQSGEFDEVAHRGVATQQRRPLAATLRARRFQQVLSALELLLEWTTAERRNFQQKVLHAELVGNARRYSAPKDAMHHGSWTSDVDFAEGVVEEPTAAGVHPAIGVQTAAGVQTAVDIHTAVDIPTADGIQTAIGVAEEPTIGDILTADGVESRTLGSGVGVQARKVPYGWRVDDELGSKKQNLESVGPDLIRQWDYDEWGDATDASLALEDELRQWLEIEIVPGAEEQIRHASLHGTTSLDEVDGDSDDSGESDDEKGNDDMYTQTSEPAAFGANAGGMAASGASADWVLTRRSGRLQILPWTAWQALYKQQIVAKMLGRERYLHLYHVVFGGSSLLDVADDESSGQIVLSALQTIYARVGPQLWMLPEEDLCRCMKKLSRGGNATYFF